MTVFIYEHISALGAEGGSDPPSAPSLLAEGRAMLAAVTADLRAIPDTQVIAWEPSTDPTGTFRRLVRMADFTLLIAPEFDGILERLAREVVAVGGKLLGPSADAIHLTADKLHLAQHWQMNGVPTPETWAQGDRPATGPFVVKRRDGAGSQGMMLVDGGAEPSGLNHLIAQQYVEGLAASVSFLIGPARAVPLIACEQLLSADGHFHYLGGRLPIPAALAARAVAIARVAVACVPGLNGYVGVDVVLGNDGRDWAIEINPRLTTSFVGLRALAKFNLAGAMMAASRGDPLPQLSWHEGPIAFTADGRILTQIKP